MNIPGFNAESAIGPTMGRYRAKTAFSSVPAASRGEVTPQLQFQSGIDIGAYWRCRLNGGSELVCRFFGGLPPFTIGSLRFNR